MLSNKEKLNFICQIEHNFEMTFRKDTGSGNLCYVANNEDLQDDFKQFFTEQDLFFFVRSFGENELKFPKDKTDFWNRVEAGKNI